MWDPNFFILHAYKSIAGIILSRHLWGSKSRLCIVNIYGPYGNRKSFWENLDSSGILDMSSLILAGDMNFTINDPEIWGQKGQSAPLAAFFSNLFNNKLLKDIVPLHSVPLLEKWQG